MVARPDRDDFRRKMEHYIGCAGAPAAAREIGVHKRTVYKWMNGVNPRPQRQARILERYRDLRGH